MKAGIATTVVPEAAGNVQLLPAAESWLELTCRWLTQAVVVALILMIAAEVFVRSVFGWSLQVTDELGGYALLTIAFVGLPTCQAHDAFHHVHFLDAKLKPLPQAWLRFAFSAISLAGAAILCWQFATFTLTTWRSGDVAATTLLTPLWIPRTVMTAGTACLCLSVLRSLYHDYQRISELRALRKRRG